ncbi:MAG: RNA-directed DNA polymerase, partial [Sediminibacterium sp.]|nr:RNA-directed DNA polymerase [Sediminibacterium sp.]
LKLDVRKYFDSIPHENLKQSISKIFIDKPLLNLKNKIIDTYSGLKQHTGVPIGNLTSQYWANHYLAQADHYIYEQLHCKGYVRYMDDMLIFENNKQALLNIGKAFNEFISTKLNLVLKPFVLNKISYGIPFLSYKVYANGIGLSQKAKRRFSQKNRLYNFNFDNQIWDEKKYISHLQPLVSFINKAKCYHFKQKQFNYE